MTDNMKLYLKKSWKLNTFRILHIALMLILYVYCADDLIMTSIVFASTILIGAFHWVAVLTEYTLLNTSQVLSNLNSRLQVTADIRKYIRENNCDILYVSEYVYNEIMSDEYDQNEEVDEVSCDVYIDHNRIGLDYGPYRLEDIINTIEDFE